MNEGWEHGEGEFYIVKLQHGLHAWLHSNNSGIRQSLKEFREERKLRNNMHAIHEICYRPRELGFEVSLLNEMVVLIKTVLDDRVGRKTAPRIIEADWAILTCIFALEALAKAIDPLLDGWSVVCNLPR